MRGLLGDANIESHFKHLIDRIGLGPYCDVWDWLNLTIENFHSLGLARNVVDSVLWHAYQDQELVLITGNRNADGLDSLEETIWRANTPLSLPVFTLANIRRVIDDQDYADLVAERLLDRLLDIEFIRGAGRIYLP